MKYCYDKDFKIVWRVDSFNIGSNNENSNATPIEASLFGLFGSCKTPVAVDLIRDDLNELLSRKPPEIKRVICNGPAVVILWEDGTKTVAKCHPNDTFSPEMGFTIAYLKKLVGNKQYRELVEKYVDAAEVY